MCQQRATNDSNTVLLVPGPVYRVVDDLSRGVRDVNVSVTVTVASQTIHNFTNPFSANAITTKGGYANFDGMYGIDTSGTVLECTVMCVD